MANRIEISLEEISLLLLPAKDYISDPIQNHPMNFHCLQFLVNTYDNSKILEAAFNHTYQL